MNYRMGPLGFALFEDGGEAGNFGMKDQRSALRWLQREVSAFGGDAAKVTIFGESAGAISVFHHVASPASEGLFRAAIAESGFGSAWGFKYGRSVTDSFAAKLGCQGAGARACLQAQSAEDIMANAAEGGNPFTSAGWGPSVDGEDMPDYPAKLYSQGRVNGVPLMAGTNTDEGNLFVWPYYPLGMTRAKFQDFVENFANGHDPVIALSDAEMAQLLEIYPTADRKTAAALITDGTFLCGTQFAGKAFQSDFFLYRFNHRDGCVSKLIIPGVFHALEIPYVFGNPSCDLTVEEHALMTRMQTYWTNFAKYLNPSPDDQAFPKYDNSSRQTLVLQTPSDVVDTDYRREQCDFNERTSIAKMLAAHGGPDAPLVEV